MLQPAFKLPSLVSPTISCFPISLDGSDLKISIGSNDTAKKTRNTSASMDFTDLTEIELPAAFDAHVHLRDGEMSQLVTPTIRQGGVNQVFVMVS